MTINACRFSDKDPSSEFNSDTGKVVLELSLKHWYGVKKRKYTTAITSFTHEEVVITTRHKLKIGQRAQLNIMNEHHILKQVPAEVLSAEYKQASNQYCLRFNLTELPEVAYKNTEFVLQQIQTSLGEYSFAP